MNDCWCTRNSSKYTTTYSSELIKMNRAYQRHKRAQVVDGPNKVTNVDNNTVLFKRRPGPSIQYHDREFY